MSGRSGARRVRSRSRPRIVSIETEQGSSSNLSPRSPHSPETARCRALRALPDPDVATAGLANQTYTDSYASPPTSGRLTPTSGFGPTIPRPLPVACDIPKLNAESQLNADFVAVEELRKRGALSNSLMEHISIFFNNKRRELSTIENMEVTSEGDSLLPRSRRDRDPRLRRDMVLAPAPPAGPTVLPPAATTSAPLPQSGSSFADALRSGAAPAAAAPPATAPPATSKPRLPPLIVEVLPNWATHFKTLCERIGHAPNARPYGRGVRFTPCSEEEYRIIQRYLFELEKTEAISWFSYALPAEKSRKVAIRGLPVTTTPEEITEALGELGYTAEYVRPIKARKGRPGCIFFAILANSADLIPGIYNVTELMFMPGVKIEAWRSKKGPAQCHRCQGFRHSSHGCHRRLACVRCGEEHAARDCPRPLEVAATCANCNGAHPANYSACPQYKREIKNKRAGTMALTREVASRNPKTSAPRVITNMVGAEVAATNLMAPANPPMERGGRRQKKRGGKRTRSQKANEALPRTSASASAAPVAAIPTLPAITRQPTHNAIDRAIDTLKDVLIALKEGRDPVQCVLSGMTNLLLNV